MSDNVVYVLFVNPGILALSPYHNRMLSASGFEATLHLLTLDAFHDKLMSTESHSHGKLLRN